MINRPTLTLLLFFTCIAGCSTAQSADPSSLRTNAQETTELTWLQGCWTTGNAGSAGNAATQVEETWRSAAGGSILFGYSVTTNNGNASFYELLAIKRNARGWTLSAYPNGVGPTDFAGTITTPTAVRFDNDANDYPQRITYERVGDKLNAKISMADGSDINRWHYERCDAGS